MHRRATIFVLLVSAFYTAALAKHSSSFTRIYKDNSPSVKQLLLQITPQGHLPVLPDGFPTLDKLKADTFNSAIKNDGVTANITLEDPVDLLGKAMRIRDVKMTFAYKRNGTQRGHWTFNARGKWRQGAMVADVRIEESKIGKHHTMVAAADSVNVYQIASSISERKSIESAGMNLNVLKSLALKDVEMYSVFKGDSDYVFMISGKPTIAGTNAKDCKVFVRRQPLKQEVFTILLEFQNDLPSIDLLKLVSDDLFKVPFINHLIAETRLFRTARVNFGFVASTGVVDKLPLKSFGGGILSNELDSEIKQGLTLLLPIQLGSATDKPVRVAVEINPPIVTFQTGKHENVSVAQTLAALAPTTGISVLPSGFPKLEDVNIDKFSYNINQETFYVNAHVEQEIEAIPKLLNLTQLDVVFRHRVGDEIDKWSFEGAGYTGFGGSVAKVVMGADFEEGKTLYFQGTSDKLSIMELAREHGTSFVPDEESKKIVESTKMNDFFFTGPTIKASYEPRDQKRFVRIYGKGHFPGVKTLTEAEAVLYEENGKLNTAVGFIFPTIPMNSLINAVSGFDVTKLHMLKNSYNVSLVLSPQHGTSLFSHPTLTDMSFARGMSMIGLIRVPENCEGSRMCENAGTMLESEWYRIKGLIKLDGFTLDGKIKRNFQIGDSLMLTDNQLEFTVGQETSFLIHSKLLLPKEELKFFGSIDFDNDTVTLDMHSPNSIYRRFQGGKVKFDNLRIKTPMLKLLPLKDLGITARMNLGEPGSKYYRSADATITYQPQTPETSRFEAKFMNLKFDDLVKALEMTNMTIPKVLSDAEFNEGFKAIYDPTIDKISNFFVTTRMHAFDRNFDAVIKMENSSTLLLDTAYIKSPFVISEGSVVIQKDQENSTGGPKLHVRITPKESQIKLIGYAKVFGISTPVNVDISDEGTGFPVYGKLFDVSDVGFLISSHDVLSSSEAAQYLAYGCLDSINKNVTIAAKDVLKKAAHEADNFIAQAHDNLKEAKIYYRKSTTIESELREKLNGMKTMFRGEEKDVWKAEEKFNNSCKLGHCKQACIGCPDWNRCCSRDVFGTCVECPSWNKCCYKTGDPVCVAKNHGCQHIRKVAEGNLDDAKDILAHQKKKVEGLTKKLFDAEFSKGKTKAVLDAAGKALSLIDHDSSIGISASKAIKKYGLDKLVNVTSICFNVPVEYLASSCVNVNVNFTTNTSPGEKSYPFSACLNKKIVPSIARFVANTVFPDVVNERHRRSLLSEENDPGTRLEMENDNEPEEHVRRRRALGKSGDGQERAHEKIEPFWDLIHEHNPLQDEAKPVPNHPTMGKATLKRKWKIPASEKGRCKTLNQLLSICRDMMKTIKHMYASYMYERYMFAKEKDNFRRKLRRVTKHLEDSAKRVSGTQDQMANIEKSLNFLSNGVRKWMDKSSKSIHKQDLISVKAWAKGMDSRIKGLGGEGVNRFLANLFKAFDGLFKSAHLPAEDTAKSLTVLQRIKKIKVAFNQIFTKEIPLGAANKYADRVMYDVGEIESVGIYCKP